MRKLKMDELGRLTPQEFEGAPKNNLIVILDNVRSLNNVGSVFRSADAFAIEAIYLCGITGTPPNKEIYKTALGASETVSWKYFKTTEEAIILLKENCYKVWAVEQTTNSVSLTEFIPESKLAVIMGNEVDGVSESAIEMCEGCIEIPQWGTKHSLNVSVAAGIVMWQVCAAAYR